MQDYHMHTTYSPDGHATMAQQLDAAERVGLSGVCLTDHLAMCISDSSHTIQLSRNTRLCRTIRLSRNTRLCHTIYPSRTPAPPRNPAQP